ncbi:MAG: hypothetical protein ACOX4O_00380 [Eubacteriales bacterium]|jgi:hypothetical protein
MKRYIRTFFELAVLSAIVLVFLPFKAVAAHKPVIAPGGKVDSPESLIAALGGDEAAYISDSGVITYLSDIAVSAPIEIISGEYTISGTGCHMTREDGYKGSFFTVTGGKLILGNEKGANTHPSLTLDGSGGGDSLIQVTGGELDIYIGTLLTGNTGTENGGAILVSGGNAKIFNAKIDNCHASDGGAIAVMGGELISYGGDYQNNTAARGGFIYIGTKGSFVAGQSVISYDTAENGGAIYNEGSCTLSEIPLSYCKASGKGGAVYNTGEFVMHGGYAAYNTADEAAVIWNSGSAAINISEFSMNEAVNYSAVYNTGSFNQIGTTISSNTASESYCVYNGGNYVLTEGGISSNTAMIRFGGIINDGSFQVDSGSISSNKSKGECQLGLAIVNRGKIILNDNAFLSFNNDVLMICGDNSKPEVEIKNTLTANTPIITLTPAREDPSSENGFKTDYRLKEALVTGEISEVEKLAVTVNGAYKYKINDNGRISWDGIADNDDGKNFKIIIIGVCVIIAAAAAAFIYVIFSRNKARKKEKFSESAGKDGEETTDAKEQ